MSKTKEQHKETILRGLSYLRSDDYERAKAAFRNYTPRQMQEQWGQSGKTCQEILDGYRKHAEDIAATVEFVKRL